MKLMRPLILALAIAGGFFYFTTWRSNSQAGGLHPPTWLSHPAQVEITEAAPANRSTVKSRTISPSTRKIFRRW